MTEYRIIAKVDPSGVTQGKAKVKQDLREIDTAAESTKRTLTRAFEAPGLERAVGTLITRMETLEKAMGDVSRSSAAVVSANTATTASLDRLGTAGVKAGAGLGAAGSGARGAATGQAALDAATRRVLQAVDQEAAELLRLNQLLAEAKSLHAQGAITSEQYARVQMLVTKTGKEQAAVTGSQRIGMQQLGFQLGDVATMYSLGAKPAQIFGSQIGQVSQALMLMGGGKEGALGKVAGFLGGPWGIALTVGTIILAPLITNLLGANNELDDMAAKLKEDARQSELTRLAHLKFNATLEGMIDTSRRLNDELQRTVTTQRQVEMGQLNAARGNLQSLRDQVEGLKRDVARAEEDKRVAEQISAGAGDAGTSGIARADQALRAAQKRLTDAQTAIARAEVTARIAEQPLIQRDVEASLDRRTAATERYTKALGNLNIQLGIGAGKTKMVNERQQDGSIKRVRYGGISRDQYQAELLRITRERDAAIQEAQTATQGTFRSRQQAIGVAGRELQRGGLRVSENTQFGGVRSNHPGMGNAAHGAYAVDVNSGSGITEANVPDLRARFDREARRYQARGYRVLWNGMVYEAGGSGPSHPIGSGDQHRDHLHLEAPQTIIGKPTGSAGASADISNENRERTAAEQQGDFISQVVDQAATRGLGNAADNVQGQIERVADDFQRRFNRAMTDAEKQTVASALNQAAQREAAAHFDENYIQPLQRLRDLQGKVGVEREILNAQMSESARLGRSLSESEAKAIRDLYEGQSAEEFNNAFIKPLERLEATQGKTGISLRVLNAQMEESERIGRALTDAEKAQIETSVRRTEALTNEAAILADVRDPLEAYRAQIDALTASLNRGDISQTQFNARVGELGASARQAISGMPGQDPNTGQSYEDIAARADEDARYAQELATFESQRAQILQLGVNYDALVEAAHRRHIQNLNNIDMSRKQAAVSAAMSTSESLLQIAEMTAGQQSVIYKAMFVASKAFAIADAIIKIQQGVANALSLPFPANLAAIAAVAAAAASIVSNIQAVSLNLADGGLIRGPGGSRGDKIPVNASDGEYMVKAAAVARPGNRAMLDAINNGFVTAHARAASSESSRGTAGGGAPRVTINNLAGGVEFEVQSGPTMEDVVIIARRVAREEAPRAVAADMRSGSGQTGKAVQRAFGIRPKRP